MGLLETRILREPWEVDPVLAGFNLTRTGLLKVSAMALAAAADATPFHAANASGTYSYHLGIYGVRDEFVGDHWKLARPNGIEAIVNESQNLLVSFSNVDVACNDFHGPKPRSKKGGGAQRASQTSLFASLPTYAPIPGDGRALYYLMVDENGATELSRPIIKDNTFVYCIDRLYLSMGGDGGGTRHLLDDSDVADNFDPQVIRKIG